MQGFWIYEYGAPWYFIAIGLFFSSLFVFLALLSFFKPIWFFVAIAFFEKPLLTTFNSIGKPNFWNLSLEKSKMYQQKTKGLEKIFGVFFLIAATYVFHLLILAGNYKVNYDSAAIWMSGALSNRNTPMLKYQNIESVLIVYGGKNGFRLQINTVQGISAETHNTSKKAVLGLQQFFVAKVKVVNPKVRSTCLSTESDCVNNP